MTVLLFITAIPHFGSRFVCALASRVAQTGYGRHSTHPGGQAFYHLAGVAACVLRAGGVAFCGGAKVKLRTFDDLVTTDLQADLSDPEFATGYLPFCLEEAQASGDGGVFLLALRDVVTAAESVAGAIQRVGKTRPSFDKSLSSKGNPQLASILRTLAAPGLRLQLVPEKETITAPSA